MTFKLIHTSEGEIDEKLLEYREGGFEDDNETTTWQEYWLQGRLVRRDAQVKLKKWPAGMAEIGLIQ
jgi:hypothetical protein